MNKYCSLQLLLIFSWAGLIPTLIAQEYDPYRFSEESMVLAEKEKRLIYLFIGSDVCLESRYFLRQIAQDEIGRAHV